MATAAPAVDLAAALAELRQVVADQGLRIAHLEGAAERRRALSAIANGAKATRAAARRRAAAAFGVELGWADAGRRITDSGIVELIRSLLADANGHCPSSSTVRGDLHRELGHPRREDWTVQRRAAAAARRRTLRLVTAE